MVEIGTERWKWFTKSRRKLLPWVRRGIKERSVVSREKDGRVSVTTEEERAFLAVPKEMRLCRSVG